MKMTLGQKRFEPDPSADKDNLVAQIKNKAAELVDIIEQARTEGCTPEKHRLISKAQTDIESGSMFAVKGTFTE